MATSPLSVDAPRDDAFWMQRALELAEYGRGRVEPNPMVGCVVVNDNVEVSHGWHEAFGGPHAEVNALNRCRNDDIANATIYVTLEPCSHHGKTPPCVELLLARRPKRVVVGMDDPFPKVSGRGIEALQNAGIPVTVGVLEADAERLNAPYLKRIRDGLPWVIAKWAMTLDGAIATRSGDSKWITGEEARDAAHRIRACMDAIIVGSETVLRDDPLLTARPSDPSCHIRPCTRIVLDRRFRIPDDCQLVRTGRNSKVLIVTREASLDSQSAKRRAIEAAGVEVISVPGLETELELKWILKLLCGRGATNVLVEGGGRLLGAFFDESLVDQVECFIAPRILGSDLACRAVAGKDKNLMNQANSLIRTSVTQRGSDFQFTGMSLRSKQPPPAISEPKNQ